MRENDRPAVSLLYHDIVSADSTDESGIVTEGSWRYKLPPQTFRDHLDVIASSSYRATTLPDVDADPPLLLTFDDGGASCAETAAPMLEEFGLRGHFFVITGRLGEPGYMTREQVRQLDVAGHHIGSHTVTHANLRQADSRQRRQELLNSKELLDDLLGVECMSLSVPGGFADEEVVCAAFEAGYEYVFVSEPRYFRTPLQERAVGRWNVWHDTSASHVENILDRSIRTRIEVQGRWYSLKLLKRLIGQERFERLRRPFVSRE